METSRDTDSRAFDLLAARLNRLLNEPEVEAESDGKSKLVIGIDFGTTYTGAAYSHTSIDIKDSTFDWTVEQARDRIFAIRNWPNADPMYPEKARTILAYQNGSVVAWGGSVRPTHSTQIAYFKLGLQDTVRDHYKTANSELEGFLKDHNWRHPDLPTKLALDYASDYIKAIHKHIMEEILPAHLGKEFMANQSIRYVLTVPAIWSDKAKDLTKRAAASAGIPEKDLDLVTEPEAAALYCSTLCNEVNLSNGDRFLICDAGGGTVDLISYEIVTRKPFRIKECTGGTGAVCGALFLTRSFEDFLHQRLGSRADILTPKMIQNAVKSFEGNVKFQFDPYSDGCEAEFEFPLRGAPDIPSIGLEEGYIKVSRNDLMQRVFLPTFSKIGELVQAQIKSVEAVEKRGIQVLFLVGGFGSNRFLANYLKSRISSSVVIKSPSAGHTAIMRGAVLYRLGLKVSERRIRRHYGLAIARPFRVGDPMHFLRLGNEGTPWCAAVMKWFVNKNDSIPTGHVVEHGFFSDDFTDEEWKEPTVMLTSRLLYCDEDEAPEYRTAKVNELCKLEVDAKKLPPGAVEKMQSPLGFAYYKITHQIAIHFNTTLEFKVMYNGEELGSVEAKYE